MPSLFIKCPKTESINSSFFLFIKLGFLYALKIETYKITCTHLIRQNCDIKNSLAYYNKLFCPRLCPFRVYLKNIHSGQFCFA